MIEQLVMAALDVGRLDIAKVRLNNLSCLPDNDVLWVDSMGSPCGSNRPRVTSRCTAPRSFTGSYSISGNFSSFL